WRVFWGFAPSLKASQFCRHTPVFCDRCRFPREAASRGIVCFLSRNPSKKAEIQKNFIQYTQSNLKADPKINDLIDWENKDQILSWLDSL
ncbi:MAG: hypothetical protein V2A70_06560, partial [Candidatus Omnitrophota bacterium]